MITIPSDLRTKEISSFISDVLFFHHTKDFYSLDDNDQDKFSALCIRALGCDIDIVLGSEGNSHLAQYLLTHDRDEAIELLDKVKESAKEKFSIYFDALLNEQKLN